MISPLVKTVPESSSLGRETVAGQCSQHRKLSSTLPWANCGHRGKYCFPDWNPGKRASYADWDSGTELRKGISYGRPESTRTHRGNGLRKWYGQDDSERRKETYASWFVPLVCTALDEDYYCYSNAKAKPLIRGWRFVASKLICAHKCTLVCNVQWNQ